MGRLNISVGGGGGISSDEVTAVLSDVLKGTTALTSDSNDEIGEGTMLDKSGTSQAAEASLDTTNSRLQMNIPETGKYSTASKLYAAYSTLATLIGLTAAKLWPGVTILGIASSKSSLAGGTYKPGTSLQTIACSGKAMTSNVIISACSLPAAANLKKGVVYTLPSGESVTGTWEGYVKDNTTKIYHNGTNYDGYTENSSYVRSGYYAVNGTWTIDTTQEYDCDRANGVIVQCHRTSDNISNTASVAVYVYDTAAAAWQLVKSQTIAVANSADPAAHYFNLGCKSGKLKLRFVLKYVNVTSIRMYV